MSGVNKSRDVTDVETMRDLQGDLVLVNPGKEDELVLTIVRRMEPDKQELVLVNRNNRKGESWPLTQELCNWLMPSQDPRAKWTLVI